MSEEKTLALEIGPSVSPQLSLLRDDLRGENQVYIERSPRFLKELKKNVNPNTVMRGDAQKLMLQNESVDIIFASALFGQASRPDVNVGDFQQIAAEWARVIKKGGKVVILETSTPANKENIINIFSNVGIKLKEEYPRGEINKIFATGDFKTEAHARILTKMSAEGSYALVLEKD